MAINTRDRRASVLHFGQPWRPVRPLPQGSIDADDRLSLLWLYSGITSSAPAATRLTAKVLAERSGQICHTLFELTVTHPTSKTWYLAPVDLATPREGFTDPDTFDPGSFATGLAGTIYQGLIREFSGVVASSAMGGVSGDSGVSLTLVNALGTGGPGRRFMDTFVTPVPGYTEPYDLLTATLRCRLYWERLPGDPILIGAALALRPDGFEWLSEPGQAETVTLTFGPDERRYQSLPRNRVTKLRYPHAPDSSINQPIIPWFGTKLRVPMAPLDADGGLWLIGASPIATPLSAVSKLWTVRSDPSAVDSTASVVLPVKITAADEAVLSIAGNSKTLALKQVAQRFELDSDGAFIYAVRLSLARASASNPCVGSISISIVTDEDGLPSSTTVDQFASSEVSAAIVTTGSFADYDIPFQSNKTPRPAYIPPNRGMWVVVKYAMKSGDMNIEIDDTGAYERGMLATQDTSSDSQWILQGKQQRRGPVRLDYTGIGQLGRNLATGAIVTRPPATIPGR